MGVSCCCGNLYWFAFVLCCGYWSVSFQSFVLRHLVINTKGAFHSTQNSGNFGWYIKWYRSLRFSPIGIFGTSFEGDPLWRVRLFRSVGPVGPFPFDTIVVPSTALLYPACTNNNQTHGGLNQVCATRMHRFIGHVEFPKFQSRIFVEWKRPKKQEPITARSYHWN